MDAKVVATVPVTGNGWIRTLVPSQVNDDVEQDLEKLERQVEVVELYRMKAEDPRLESEQTFHYKRYVEELQKLESMEVEFRGESIIVQTFTSFGEGSLYLSSRVPGVH